MVEFVSASFGAPYYAHTYQVYEDNIHNKLIAKVRSDLGNGTIEQERANASKMTEYFQRIKNGIKTYNPKNSITDPLVADLMSANKALISNRLGLFYYKSNLNKTDSGALFEYHVAKIITAVMNTVEGKSTSSSTIKYQADKISVGNESVGVNAVGRLSQTMVDELNEVVNKDIKNILAKVEEDGKEWGFIIDKKQGKIDVAASKGEKSYLSITPTSDIQDFYQLLAGSTFTAKNYYELNSIHLGTTTPFRAFAAALSFYSNAPLWDIETLYYASLNSCTQKAIVNKHLEHLYMAYELSGIGLKGGSLTTNGIAQYLIVNKRAGDDVQVLSTKAVIADMLEGRTNALTRDDSGATYINVSNLT